MQIEGKVFIVTGASSGIGLETAKAITAKAGKVALLARSTQAIDDLSKELTGSLAVTCDVTDFSAIREAVQTVHSHYGQIDGLINNAGRSYAGTVETIEPEAFDEIFHLNVLAPIIAIQAVVPIMRAQGGGCIVNINSGTAFMVIPSYSVYSCSKRAFQGFSMAAREELAGDNILVSQVYPAVTATNFGVNRMTAPNVQGPPANYASGQPANEVADVVVEAIEGGGAHYYCNEFIEMLAHMPAVEQGVPGGHR
ncbi:MAG TPA: SDR family NAD(P)-dependent oxidoreductase [Fimbriimonadaceae bacterium]|jgi:short-subunit dehydrogenase